MEKIPEFKEMPPVPNVGEPAKVESAPDVEMEIDTEQVRLQQDLEDLAEYNRQVEQYSSSRLNRFLDLLVSNSNLVAVSAALIAGLGNELLYGDPNQAIVLGISAGLIMKLTGKKKQ